MSQAMVTKNNRYVRTQSYSDTTISACIPKEFCAILGIGKKDTLKMWVENNILHAVKAE